MLIYGVYWRCIQTEIANKKFDQLLYYILLHCCALYRFIFENLMRNKNKLLKFRDCDVIYSGT